MKVGDLVKRHWHLDSDSWDPTQMQGLIVSSRLLKSEHEQVVVFNVFLTDGTLCDVREDDGLELLA